MVNREELHSTLLSITPNVYYQTPPNIQMEYPAIIYTRKKIDNKVANNKPYMTTRSYEVTVVDWDPDSPIVDKLALLDGCEHDRHYYADGLNHDVFTIKY